MIQINSSLKNINKTASDIYDIIKNYKYILLSGDIGAGKTTLVAEIAKHINIKNIVISPTFSIINTYYSDDMTVMHADLYRLQSDIELEQTGFYELIDEADIVFIEWADKFNFNKILSSYADISITKKNNLRVYSIELHG